MAKDDNESSAENLSDKEDLTDPTADENLPDEDLTETISSIQDLYVAGKQSKISRKPSLASLSSVAYNLCDLVTASSAKLPRRKRKYFPGHDLDDHFDDDDDEDDAIGKGIKIPSSKKMKLSISTSSSDSLATDDLVGGTTPPVALLSASANQDSDQVDHHQGTDQDNNQESPSPNSILSSRPKESKPSSDEEKGLELD